MVHHCRRYRGARTGDLRPPWSFRVEVGHTHGVKPNNLVGAIANEADQTAAKVENKVGDVDVDVNVTRKDDEHTNQQ